MADKEATDVTTAPVKTSSNPLAKKLNKVLDTRLENDKELLEALKALSGFFEENCLRSRRNLRSDIERRSLEISEQFVDAFKAVKQELDDVYTEVKAMNACCQDMTQRLKLAKEQTHDLLYHSTSLKSESSKIQMKSQVTELFIQKFLLTPDEVKILRGLRPTVLHTDFFDVLNRVKQIHSDCKFLLRTNHQTAGLEIMEAMALHQETAYERLYRWTQNESRLLTADYPDISPMLSKALLALADRPVLFSYSVDEYSTARRTAVVRGFIDALTRGGAGGTPRPIELHAHDPLRYVGDMLAWVHQSTASEKEHLQTLLKLCSDVESTITSALAPITEGLCRPIKVRVEQVLISETDAVILYKLSNLLKFYHHTVSQMLPEKALLLSTTSEMEILAHKMFFNSLSNHANRLLDKVELPPLHLTPTSTLTASLDLVKEVLSSHDSFVIPIADKKHNFHKILSYMVEPLLQMCSMSASQLNRVDMATYMINCIYQIQSLLALYEYTEDKIEMLQAQIDAHVDTLISELASLILTRVNLIHFYSYLQQHGQQKVVFSEIDGFDSLTLKTAMMKFDSFLATPDSLDLNQSSLLLSNKIRETVRRKALDLVISAYTLIYDVINNMESGYTDPGTIVPRTPQQVQKLLA